MSVKEDISRPEPNFWYQDCCISFLLLHNKLLQLKTLFSYYLTVSSEDIYHIQGPTYTLGKRLHKGVTTREQDLWEHPRILCITECSVHFEQRNERTQKECVE